MNNITFLCRTGYPALASIVGVEPTNSYLSTGYLLNLYRIVI